MHNHNLHREVQKLDSLLNRTQFATMEDIDLIGHWGQYLCVMVAGFLENSLQMIFGDYVQKRAHPRVFEFAQNRLARISNPNAERFIETARFFDQDWARQLKDHLEADSGLRKNAINSIMKNRHKIVHGESSQISMSQVREYFPHCVQVVNFIEALVSE